MVWHYRWTYERTAGRSYGRTTAGGEGLIHDPVFFFQKKNGDNNNDNNNKKKKKEKIYLSIYHKVRGFNGIYIIFLGLAQNIDCRYLLELPYRVCSDKWLPYHNCLLVTYQLTYIHHINLDKNSGKYHNFLINVFSRSIKHCIIL